MDFAILTHTIVIYVISYVLLALYSHFLPTHGPLC